MDTAQQFEVGRRYPGEGFRFPMPVAAAQYNYDVAGHVLQLFWPGATGDEVRAVRSGVASFALAVEGPAIFLCHRFGEMSWSDAPYSVHLVPPERRRATLADPSSGKPWNRMEVHLVDGRSGVLRALKVYGMSGRFAAAFEGALRAQLRDGWPGGEGYDRALAEVYGRYPHSSDLARAAVVRDDFPTGKTVFAGGVYLPDEAMGPGAEGEPRNLIREAIGDHMLVAGKGYPGPLPGALSRWYCYTLDGGHSIAVVTEQHFEPGVDAARYLVPAPVKTVLREGWRTSPEGLVVADIPYSPGIGLRTERGDDEF